MARQAKHIAPPSDKFSRVPIERLIDLRKFFPPAGGIESINGCRVFSINTKLDTSGKE
jgi:hypothetical protein